MTVIREALMGRIDVMPALAAELHPPGESLGATQAGPNAQPGEALIPRQLEILKRLAEGRSAKEIGRRLAISPRILELHKNRTMGSLGPRTRAQLVCWAIQQGMVSP
jgi:DNA-binding NarL/FixJ family response regulator